MFLNRLKARLSNFVCSINYERKISSTLLNLLLSYFIVIVVCTAIISGFSYQFIFKNMENQTIKANSELLGHLKKSVDSFVLLSIDKISLSILQDTADKQDIIYFFSNPVEGNVSGIGKAYNHLRSLKVLNPVIDSISIYYKKNNIVLSTEGMKYLSLPFKQDWIDVEWIKILDSMDGNYTWVGARKVKNPNSVELPYKNVITFIRKFPFSTSNNNLLGGIAISISEDVLYNIIKDSAPIDFGQILIVNENGTVILHSEKKYLNADISKLFGSSRDKINNSSRNGYFTTNFNGKKSVVSYVTSEYNNWKYIAIKPVFKITEGYRYLNNVIIFIALFILLIGVILTLLSARNFYSPLKKLVRVTRAVLASSPSELVKNEYDFINTALNSLAFKVKEQEKKLEDNIPILKHHFLLNLINGNYLSREEVNSRLKQLRIDFYHDFYCIIILKVGKVSSMDLKTFEYTTIEIMEYIERNSFNMDVSFYCTKDGDSILSVVNLKFANIDVAGIVKEICKYVKETHGIRVNAGIGSICDDVLSLSRSYSEAQTCVKYSYIYPDKDLFLLNEVLNWENNNREFEKLSLEEFSNSLTTQNKAAALSSLHSLVSSIRNECYPYNYVMNILYHIITSVADTLERTNTDKTVLYDRNIYSYFNKISNIEELELWIGNILEQIFVHTDDWQCERNKELVKKVKEYINANIANQDISLNSVANAMYLSPNYLSRIFKEETGIYFIDYLIEARLELAKELLTSTNLSIEEIATVVGYSSSQYFIKKFKSKYGKTPKQYKIKSAIS
ncbi:MAG: helix-turn-helix domain-containing protein [Firmicutes bacterium]|nr:helix-turn-helix domain-containing protein [Bacillota bacterium]